MPAKQNKRKKRSVKNFPSSFANANKTDRKKQITKLTGNLFNDLGRERSHVFDSNGWLVTTEIIEEDKK